MQVGLSSPNNNFTGRYRVLLSTNEFDGFVKNVLPELDKIHDGKVDYFYGKSPSENEFAVALNNYAKANNSSIEWAVSSAKNHGIKMNTSDGAILWLATGDDMPNFLKFNNKCQRKFDLRFILEGAKLTSDDIQKSDELIELESINNVLQREAKDFFRFMKQNQFKKMKSAEEILQCEKQNLNITL